VHYRNSLFPCIYDFDWMSVPTVPVVSCRLTQLKSRIRAARTTAPLFDTEAYTHSLEELYSLMWDRHERGLSPDHLTTLQTPLSTNDLDSKTTT